MSQAQLSPPSDIGEVVARALAEDVGGGDLTAALVDENAHAEGQVRVREAAVLCGGAWFDEVFRQLDPGTKVQWHHMDGERVTDGTIVCNVTGQARAVLSGERTALNFLQTLSGTATAARQFVDAVDGTNVRILDTRKTIPGLRQAQKYAVRCGGAHNHRMGLFDAVLIKENHIAAAGSIAGAVAAARRRAPDVLIEIEVERLGQIEEALGTDADRLLLDNMVPELLRQAVALRDASTGRDIELEASGSIGLDNVREVAETGVDYISIGAITKHACAIDFSMRFI